MCDNDCSCERAGCENEVVRFGTGDVAECGAERTENSGSDILKAENVSENTGGTVPLAFEGRRRRYCRKRRDFDYCGKTHRFSPVSILDT